MCNARHDVHEAVALEGEAFKIINVNKAGHPHQVVRKGSYAVDEDGWIRWKDEDYPIYGVGFCFIPTKEEADIALQNWMGVTGPNHRDLRYEIVPVKYRGGIEQHVEHGFVGINEPPVNMILATEFRIMKDLTCADQG